MTYFLKGFESTTSEHDLIFYRIGAILGILYFPSIPYFYNVLFKQTYPFIFSIFIVMIVFVVLFIVTIIKSLNKDVYFVAIVTTYVTTLYFISMMILRDFDFIVVLLVVITITILASGLRTEKSVNTYLVTMITVSVLSVLILKEFSIMSLLSIISLICWPLLLHYMLKSKFMDNEEIQKQSKFLQMVITSIKDPTILIENDTLKVIDCSASTIEKFNLEDVDSIIGKTIKDINNLYLNNVISKECLLMIDALTTDRIEFDLTIESNKMYFQINSNEFEVDGKSYKVLTIFDITEEKTKNNQILNLALTDELTNIDNRRSGISKLKKAILESEKLDSMFAIYFVDIDEFKNINDLYGHDKGDIILSTVANRLSSSTSDNDIVCRIGGDEFMIITKDLPSDKVVDSIARRILTKVKKPIYIDDESFTVTISVGICISKNQGYDYKTLLKRADIALYESKKLGRNQYSIY